MGKFNLSDTELEIMNLLWGTDQKMTFRQILDYCNNELDKNWQRQTLRTQIVRLESKGLLFSQKENGLYVYRPLISEAENKQAWTRGFLNELFDGSIRNFLLALSGERKLDEDIVKELKELINNNRAN